MKVSYLWLSDYVDLSGITPQELAEKLTRSGIEVESIDYRNKGIENVVVGFVLSKEKHPDADKLNVCLVDAGTGEKLQIVCGAKNVDAGQKVPVALVGAKLPGDLHIKRAKLRGVESQGMICSAKELGMNDKLLPKEQQEGILVLPESAPVGRSILEELGLEDAILELGLTPNRSDCLSMLGVAYEVAAILGRQVSLPDPQAGMNETAAEAAGRIAVSIAAEEQCGHYAVRLIEGVRVGPSPLWLQSRLMAAGIRPISNIVDITNFVMLEYGQPLHAFDAARIAGGHIGVRLAKEGERLMTLDGAERTLEPHMLLITDAEKPVGLAGVMGGANSEVEDGTTTIVLESARFSGASVRRTSRQLGLRSEASLRFEKEVNPEAVRPALDRAASLMAQLAGGAVAKGVVEQVVSMPQPQTIDITVERINNYLGTFLTGSDVESIFGRLGFQTVRKGDGGFSVTVPLRRGDITRDVDLIEEVARLYGYDNIEAELMHGVTTPGALTREQAARRLIRRTLTQSGLNEAVTYSLTLPAHNEHFRQPEDAGLKPIPLAMPMSEERSVLRSSALPHLMEVAVYNRNRNQDDVAVFEIASAFLASEDKLTKLPEEVGVLAGLWAGNRHAAHWNVPKRPVDFYDVKGVLEKLFDALGITGVRYESAQPQGCHPGRTAAVYASREDGSPILLGYVGQLHPELQKSFDLSDTYVFEFRLSALYETSGAEIAYRTLPRFPAVTRDIAVAVSRDAQVGKLADAAKAAGGEWLESVQVFDVYTGDRIAADKKSAALALVYRHPDRTLTDEEVAAAYSNVVQALEREFGAELRK